MKYIKHVYFKVLIIFIVLFNITCFNAITYSQQTNILNGAWNCNQEKIHGNGLKAIKLLNSQKHSFDVLKYTLNVDLFNCFSSPYPHSFSANEIISFKIDTALSSINLNAVNNSLVIDSVNMSATSFMHVGNILNIKLNRMYNPGEITKVKIYYHHRDVKDSVFYTGNGIVYTDCEPEGARKWFPCWDKPSDKALSEITAKVPVGVLFGSNGSLQDSTVNGDSLYYHWVNHDPIATYLMVMTSKIGYKLDMVYWHKHTDSTKLVPVRFYYNRGENPAPSEDIICNMTTFYSSLFGEYPFEKIGFATLDTQFTWGGMEDQTLISLCPGCWQPDLISHEFAHHWFGDMISPATWADVFLNEGFATYCEALWDEHSTGYERYKYDIFTDAYRYLLVNPGWAIYNPSWAHRTPDTDTLFNVAISYYKGTGLLHMFRRLVGDSVFFAAIKSYATDTVNFKYRNATIPDFITKMNLSCGQNLDWFFDEWLKQPNHPVYKNNYNIINNGNDTWTVNFTVKQVQPNAGFFRMPIKLRVVFGDLNDTSIGDLSDTSIIISDTTIKVINDANNQVFSFTFSKQPHSVEFDPDNDIVLKQATLTEGTAESKGNDNDAAAHLYQNTPNPCSGKTQIAFELPSAMSVKIVIYDMHGQTVCDYADTNMSAGKQQVEFDASGLKKGAYYYSLETGHRKIVKKMSVK
jgi:aminopeptidase N